MTSNTTVHDHKFTKNGRVTMIARDRGNEQDLLSPGVHLIKFHPEQGFYLNEQEPLQFPSKVYGDTPVIAEKILNTFLSREGKNTGILLTGNKGSGKTMLTKKVCSMANGVNLPVLLLEDAFAGTAFTEFMNSIVQPCLVLIDEFEKKYKKEEDQNDLLSLLDGTGFGQKMFMLTSNSEKVSEYLISRPSRLFYHYRYGKLEEAVLVGYCKDNLKDEKHLKNIHTLWSMSSDMSFDVLQSIVEELNRYPNDNFVDLICAMNVSLGDALRRRYALKSASLDGEELDLYRGFETCDVNLMNFQEGLTRINTSLDIDQWLKQTFIFENMSAADVFFYNKDLYEKAEKEDEESLELIKSNGFDSEFVLNLNFNASLGDRMSTEEISFNRDVGGKQLKIVWQHQKEDSVMTFFRKMFD